MLLQPHGVTKKIWSLTCLETPLGAGECQSRAESYRSWVIPVCGVCRGWRVEDTIWGLWVFPVWGWLLLKGLRLHGAELLVGQEAKIKTLFRGPPVIPSNECGLPCLWIPRYLVRSALSFTYMYAYRLFLAFKSQKPQSLSVLDENHSNRGAGSDFLRYFDTR